MSEDPSDKETRIGGLDSSGPALRAGKVVRWASLGLAVVALWASVPMWRFGLEATRYPFQLDPIEGKVLQHALWMNDGRSIYRPITEEPPWVVGNYPPLYPLMCSWGVNPTLPDFAWPRTLALLSTLMAGLALGGVVWRSTKSLGCAALGAGLWWATYEVYLWAPLCRVDLPALALGGVGLALGVNSLGRWRWWRVVLVCAVFWLAWLTRQTQVLLPGALLVWLVLTDRRWAWRFALVWLGGIAALLSWLTVATGGQFWVHTVLHNLNASVPGQLEIWLRHVLLFWKWGLVALALGMAGTLLSLRVREGALGVVLLALVANIANVVATGKVGADKNYLLEPLWCLGALLPMLWRRAAWGIDDARTLRESAARANPALQWARGVLFGLLTAALAFQALMSATSRVPDRPLLEGMWPDRRMWRAPVSERDRRRDVEIIGILEDLEGPILSEYGIYALRTGRELVHEPFLMTRLVAEGRWDETPLLDRIRAQEFAAILVEDDLADPGALRLSATGAFADAVRTNYTLEREWPGIITQRLWLPRGRDQEGGAERMLIR